jgi:hypothetical protein
MVMIMFCFSFFREAKAAINPLINFTGKVTNLDGSEVADGTYDFVFKLYTAPTGGTPIWTENLASTTRFSAVISDVTLGATSTTYAYTGESATTTFRIGQYLTNASTSESVLIVDFDTATGTVSVASGSPAWSVGQAINNRPIVEGGVININLGSVTDLASVDFNQPLYLEVTFNSETMQPRKNITAVTQAFESAKLGGKGEDEYATLAEDETITGEWSFNNIMSISASSTSAALTVTQNGSGNIVEFKAGATTAFAVRSDGKIQFGDYVFPETYVGSSPGYVLKVDAAGNMYWEDDFGSPGASSNLWASTSDDSILYQEDTGMLVVLGDTATMTPLSYHLQVRSGAWFEDDIGINGGETIRFYDADDSNYISFIATNTVTSNYSLVFPGSIGSEGEALILDASGNLVWGSPTTFIYVNPGTEGQIPYYAADGSQLSATSSIFISQDGKFGIGTTTPSYMFTLGTTTSGQFSIDSSGRVRTGTWQANIIDEIYGGLGTSTYAVGDLIYGSAPNTLDTLSIGSFGNVLTVSSGGIPTWTATGSLQIAINDTTGILGATRGGTGDDSTSWPRGLVQVDGSGVWSSSSTVSIGFGGTGTTTTPQSGYMLIGNAQGRYEFVASSTLGSEFGTVNSGYSGWIPYYAVGGKVLTATSSIYISDNGNIGIATTAPTYLFTIGNASGSQFMVDDNGIIRDGSWQGDIIAVNYGGTGRTSFQTGSLVYATSTNVLDEVLLGGDGSILQIVSNTPTWVSTSSLGIDFNAIGGMLATDQGGTGQNSSGWNGIVQVVGGTWGTVNGTANNIAYWSDNNTIEATSTIYFSDSGLVGIGTTSPTYLLSIGNTLNNQFLVDGSGIVKDGTWEGDIISVTYGGTGTSTFEAGSLVYATTSNTISEILLGANGYLLQVINNVPTWVSTSSLGVDFGDVSGVVPIDQGGTGTSTTPSFGQLLMGNASNEYDLVSTSSLGLLRSEDIGSLLQGYDSDLATLAGFSPGTDLFLVSDSDSWTTESTSTARTTLGVQDIFAYGVNSAGVIGQIWMSNGSGRGGWTATNTLQIALTDTTGVLAVDRGGTGSSTPSGLLYGDGAGNITSVTDNSTNWNTAYSWGDHRIEEYFSTTTDILSIEYGGTGTTTFAVGSLLYASTSPSQLSEVLLGTDGYILQVLNGRPTWVSTTTLGLNLNELGGILPISKGGTGAGTVAGARTNLDLDEIYEYAINSTSTYGYVWIASSTGRGQWVATSSLNVGGVELSRFVGTTSVEYDGSFATGTLSGYKAANDICDAEFPNSHFCRTYDILISVEIGDTSNWDGTRSWVAEGPPGFTSDSNDCNGWTTNDSTKYGAWWEFDTNGGKGWLIYCDYLRPLACCNRIEQ